MSFTTQMMTFIAVVEAKSFTQAARRLSITPTAVSKQIKQLEEHLTQQLLERDTRKVKVTEIGEQFYTHCKRVEQEVMAAKTFIRSQSIEPQGQLRILCAMIFANTYLIKNLQIFHERYPKIQLNIELAERIPDREDENFDILVGFSLLPQIPIQLRSRPLLKTRYVLCAAPHYLKKNGTPKVLDDLQQHQLISHPLRTPINLIRVQKGTEVYMPPPEIVINSLDALVTLCCEGAGILLATEMQVGELLQREKLIRLLPDYPWQEVSMYLFYRYLEYEQQKVRCFIDFCLEVIEK